MNKRNLKRLVAVCTACLGLCVFGIAGCKKRDGESHVHSWTDWKPDETDASSGHFRQSKCIEHKTERENEPHEYEDGACVKCNYVINSGPSDGGDDKDDSGDEGDKGDEPAVPATQGEYVKTFIPDNFVNNRSFYNYICGMTDYDANSEIAENALYASPDGTGSGESKADATDIQSAIDAAEAGQTVYITGGTYALDESVWVGTSGNGDGYITIRNYPGETPLITASAAAVTKNKEFPIFALDENVGYLIIEGLDFCNVKTDTAIGIAAYDGGQHEIVVRNNRFYNLETNNPNNSNCGANAILLFGEKTAPMSNWLIYGNECYDNVLGWCEAVSVTANCEYIYVINNDVHDNTNIGIDFTGNFGYCKDKALDQPRYCIAAGNVVKNCVSDYAECAGLYVDGARDILLVNNYLEGSQYGIEVGSEEKSVGYTVKNISVYNNVIVGNHNCGIRVGGYDKKSSGVVENCVIVNNTLVNNNVKGGESEFVLSMLDGLIIANNLVTSEKGSIIYTDMTEAETKNVTVKNNCFIGGKNLEFGYFGSTYSSIENFNAAVGGNNITGQVELTDEYTVQSGVTVDAGDNSYVRDIGYDYNFRDRIINGKVDIGATEKA